MIKIYSRTIKLRKQNRALLLFTGFQQYFSQLLSWQVGMLCLFMSHLLVVSPVNSIELTLLKSLIYHIEVEPLNGQALSEFILFCITIIIPSFSR